MNQEELRKAIREVRAAPGISDAQKTERIRGLMASRSFAVPAPPTEVPKETGLPREVSYHDPERGLLGCPHYRRNCRVRAPCCGKLYGCRFCHDEASDHEIDRRLVASVQCMLCGEEGPIGRDCTRCGGELARYYCEECRFLDDSPDKEIHHCAECGICRVGQREEYFHCSTCEACFRRSADHRCVPKVLDTICPVCHEGLFATTREVFFPHCQHPLHIHCARGLQTNHCPLCRKSLWLYSEEALENIAEAIALQPMPEELRGSSTVYCNDCEKEFTAPFHALGHLCPDCGQPNTAIRSTLWGS